MKILNSLLVGLTTFPSLGVFYRVLKWVQKFAPCYCPEHTIGALVKLQYVK